MTTVVLEKCDSYAHDTVSVAVEKALSCVLGSDQYDLNGKKVLLKPNLLSARQPSRGITTHPAIVGAVIDYFRDRGADVSVGDSPAGAMRGLRRVWENTGMLDVCERKHVRLVNFEAGGLRTRSVEGRPYEIAKVVDDFDAIVSLPKLKTHVLTVLTGCVKNMFGCVPGFRKSALHLAYPSPTAMSRALVDVFSLVKPWISLVDAVYAMEGNGPSSGSLRHLGFIAAGTDCVALDATLARAIGIDPMQVPTTREAWSRGLGEADAARISLEGLDLDEVIPDAFTVPSNWKFFLIPGVLGRLLAKFIWVRPEVQEDSCTLCGECVAVCPAESIRLSGHKVVVDEGRCVFCLCCHETCAAGAISMEMSLLARLLA
jgi:uncharacterized protein (DUF362 family)/Pyruvate/2-oxoacid:ferredoxin oxidoreductase delta subunit